MNNQWNRIMVFFLSKRYERNFPCIAASDVTLGTLPIFDPEIPIDIDHKAFRLMECEPLIDMEGNEVKAAAECVFVVLSPRAIDGAINWCNPFLSNMYPD